MRNNTSSIGRDAMELVDFHTHILPKMDDGSGGTLESVNMLCALRDQGVAAVVATSHFYPETEDPGKFLERRSVAIKALIYVGAEVAYFDGISTSEAIHGLCIDGTDLMLVEMPFKRWSHAMVEEICYLSENAGVRPVIAHVERYFPYCRNSMIRYLASKGILIQSNASAFSNKITKYRALRLVREGVITLIGSDCHNMSSRKPNIHIAEEIIRKKIGEDFRAIELGDTLLMVAAGAVLGTKAVIVSTLIGIVAAALGGVINKMVSGESKFAFGPFLAIGIAVGLLWGNEIADWYIGLLKNPVQ